MTFKIEQNEDNVIVDDVVVFECKTEDNAGVLANRLDKMLNNHVVAIVIPEEIPEAAEDPVAERLEEIGVKPEELADLEE